MHGTKIQIVLTNNINAIKCYQIYCFCLQISLILKVLKAMQKVYNAVLKQGPGHLLMEESRLTLFNYQILISVNTNCNVVH